MHEHIAHRERVRESGEYKTYSVAVVTVEHFRANSNHKQNPKPWQSISGTKARKKGKTHYCNHNETIEMLMAEHFQIVVVVVFCYYFYFFHNFQAIIRCTLSDADTQTRNMDELNTHTYTHR